MTSEGIWECALRSIADDYESFERILREVTEWAAEGGTVASSSATQSALEELIRDGYAQAYSLSVEPPGRAEAVTYSAAQLEELWFYVTPEGKQLIVDLNEKLSEKHHET